MYNVHCSTVSTCVDDDDVHDGVSRLAENCCALLKYVRVLGNVNEPKQPSQQLLLPVRAFCIQASKDNKGIWALASAEVPSAERRGCSVRMIEPARTPLAVPYSYRKADC